MNFERALITGASSGIGEALAHLLSKKKMKLILTGRNGHRLQQVAEQVGAEEILVADLAKKEERQLILEKIAQKVPDLVINNAGFAFYGDLTTLSVSDQLAMAEVNAIAPLQLTIASVQALLAAQKRGVVVNVSSTSGEIPTPGMSVYGASKAFVTQFSQAMNTEIQEQGISILVSCPGMVATEFAQRAARKKITPSGGPILSAEYAAAQIWKQIEKNEEKRIFNWQYRLGLFVAHNFVPISMIKKWIWKQVRKRQ